MKKLLLLNSAILTSEGTFTLRTINLTQAQRLVQKHEIISAIGHQSTADVMTELLGAEIPANRIMVAQESGQKALIFRLNGRPAEGKILSRDEIEAMGYSFQELERVE